MLKPHYVLQLTAITAHRILILVFQTLNVIIFQLFRVIIIIFINCNWAITRWQWLYYMYTNMERERKKVTRKFKSGGLHERHVVATWKLGNHLSIHL